MGLKWFFIGVDIDRIDKMAPRGVKTAPGAIELNRHFGAKTDLLNLQCAHLGKVAIMLTSEASKSLIE